MKKTHKRLLGVGGLALVATLTTVAYSIPEAGAVSTTASGQVNVNVVVVGHSPEIRISSPLDGAKLTSSILHIVTSYEDADQVTYTLTSGSRSVVITSPELSGNATEHVGNSGTHDFTYDLKDFDPSTAGYGSYTLKVTVERQGSTVEDTVSFSYSAASIDDGTIETDENNNPIITVNVKPDVVKVKAIVLKPNGEKALETTVDTDGQSSVDITLPFSDNQSLESDTYTVKFITYSDNGNGQVVADQTESNTPYVTQVTYDKKVEPELPPDDTPPAPLDPSAGDQNNPVVPGPEDAEKGDKVHVVVTDPETGKVVFEGDLPVDEDGKVHIPFDEYNIPEGEYNVEITPYDKEGNLDPSKATEAHVEYKGKTEENQPTTNKDNGNPVVPIANDGTVEKAKIIITDKNGKETIVIVDVKPGQTEIEIPFDELGLPAGDYDVKIITYSRDPETGKLVPNQNPAYVQPIPFSYSGSGEAYGFIDQDNKLGTHTWNRNSSAGSNQVLRIPEADAYRFFDANEVYFTTAANVANLFNSSSRLNKLYFTARDDDGGIAIELHSSFLATLPNGDYYVGIKLTNGAERTVKITITGNTGTNNNIPNPVIDINVEEGVEKVVIIVYDKNGKELFRFEAPVSSINTNHITLPFDLYGLTEGDYLIAVIPYARDANGNLVPLISEEEAKRNAFQLTYGFPEVPNTGGFLSSLNLSEKDYLVTGLIIFGIVTAAGAFILYRKKETRH